jgi:hypothetical protein
MTTLDSTDFLLKKENKDMKTEFDLAQWCWITKRRKVFFRLLNGKSDEEVEEVVVLIKQEQRDPLWYQLIQMRLVEW